MKPTAAILGGILMFSFFARAEMPKVGDVAPDFTAAASDGSTVKLKDAFSKGPVVLYFYPKDDTPGCTKEACGIRDGFAAFRELKATVFGVSFDSVESHKKFVAKYNLPFLLLADTDKKIAVAYGAAGEKGLFPSRITFIIGTDGKITHVFPKVSPGEHSAELQKALAELKK
jgi:peroxiredoxin Q/BCP